MRSWKDAGEQAIRLNFPLIDGIDGEMLGDGVHDLRYDLSLLTKEE